MKTRKHFVQFGNDGLALYKTFINLIEIVESRTMLTLKFTLFSFATLFSVASFASVSSIPVSNVFQVQVTQNGIKAPVFTYKSESGTNSVPEFGNMGQANKSFHYALFSGAGPFVIQVTKLGSKATSASIHPNRNGIGTINAVVDSIGSTVSFKLSHSAKITVEFSDDPNLVNPLAIIAHPSELPADVPNVNASSVFVANAADYPSFRVPPSKSVVYFPPGIHQIGYWVVPTTVNQIYLADGAYVRGYFNADRTGAAPIKINGRGILTNDIYPFHQVDGSGKLIDFMLQISGTANGSSYETTGHTIEGITLTDSSNYVIELHASNSVIEDVMIHGWKFNNDAIHVGGSNDLLSNNFYHVNDDQVCADGATANLTVQNSIFFPMSGGSVLQLGWWPHSISGVTFKNSDLIHHSWGSALTARAGSVVNSVDLQPGQKNNPLVKNVTVSDIYIDVPIPRFLDLRMIRSGGPSTPYPLNFENFTFTNIHMDHQGDLSSPLILLDQVDSTHTASGFTFTNFSINGATITPKSPIYPSLILLNGHVPIPVFQ